MTSEAVIVIARKDGFLAVAPATGACAEHADLAEAYRLAASQGPAPRPLPSDGLGHLMPFFIKAATVAVVGAFLLITAGIAVGYALQEPVGKAGQKAARAALASFGNGFAQQLRETSPDQQERIHAQLREAVPLLRPYAQDLKPLFE